MRRTEPSRVCSGGFPFERAGPSCHLSESSVLPFRRNNTSTIGPRYANNAHNDRLSAAARRESGFVCYRAVEETFQDDRDRVTNVHFSCGKLVSYLLFLVSARISTALYSVTRTVVTCSSTFCISILVPSARYWQFKQIRYYILLPISIQSPA